MIDLDVLYFDWLLTRLHPDGVSEELAYLCELLHLCPFERRVGNDINRARDGANLRKEFFSDYDEANFAPHVTNDLMMLECSWFEMLVALVRHIDFTYDGGVEARFLELVRNLGLESFLNFNPAHRGEMMDEYDQRQVALAVRKVDQNLFDENGHGGLFPLNKDGHPDQREVEIWDQSAAYFRERLEGVLWTSTS